MKNEVFVRAMTEIDEELIISAHKNMVQKPKKESGYLLRHVFF